MGDRRDGFYIITLESAKTAFLEKHITAYYLVFVYLQIRARGRGYLQIAVQTIIEDLDLHSTTVYAALRKLKKHYDIQIKRGLAKVKLKRLTQSNSQELTDEDWVVRFQRLNPAEQEEYLKACGVFDPAPDL